MHGQNEAGGRNTTWRWRDRHTCRSTQMAREVRTSALTELERISERERMGCGFSPKEVADALKRLEASEATLQQITERRLMVPRLLLGNVRLLQLPLLSNGRWFTPLACGGVFRKANGPSYIPRDGL